jgi:hypothetical protein
MTSQGNANGRFTSAIRNRDLLNAEIAAREIGSSRYRMVATVDSGQLDQVGGRAWEVAARDWPQLRQMVVPLACAAAGYRIKGMLPRPTATHATCSVSRAQLER